MFDMKAYQDAYRAAHREEAKEYAKSYRMANVKQIAEKRAEAYQGDRANKIKISTAWQKRNKASVNAKNKAYKAAKLQRTPKWLTELQYDHIEIFYEAASFMTKEVGISFEVDHVVPLKGKHVSGLHVPWNLQVITGAENNKKNNKFGEL